MGLEQDVLDEASDINPEQFEKIGERLLPPSMKRKLYWVKTCSPQAKLEQVQKKLPITSNLRISKRGVPHLVVTFLGVDTSITYFRGKEVYKIFYPYPSDQQTRITMKTQAEVLEYFRDPK